MTAQTPVYGIKYPVAGEPIRTTRQILEDNAKATEAAMLARAVPPADLAALIAAGWFTDTGWQNITLASGVTTTALGARYRRTGRRVSVQAELAWSAGIAANKVLGTVPDLASRPGRAWWLQVPLYGGTAAPLYIDAGGQLISANALPAGGCFLMTSFPLD
jgi:hypothetical protein